MKAKKLLLIPAIAGIVFSCGPSEQEKQKIAQEEKVSQEKKLEEQFMNRMDSIQKLTKEVVSTMAFVKDTVIRYQDGTIYVPSDEIWEIKEVLMASAPDSMAPPTTCECDFYQKTMESSTSSHDAIIQRRCIKFNGVFEVNEYSHSSTSFQKMTVNRPKYIPSDVDITAMAKRVLVIRMNKIKDMQKMNEIKRLVELTKVNPNHALLKQYYYTHCFNADFESMPLKFGTCTELTD